MSCSSSLNNRNKGTRKNPGDHPWLLKMTRKVVISSQNICHAMSGSSPALTGVTMSDAAHLTRPSKGRLNDPINALSRTHGMHIHNHNENALAHNPAVSVSFPSESGVSCKVVCFYILNKRVNFDQIRVFHMFSFRCFSEKQINLFLFVFSEIQNLMIVVKAGGCGEHGTLMRQEAIIMIRSTANIIAFALMHACESISLFLVRVSMQTCTA